MKSCKKLTAIVIALVLSLSVCIGAFAAQEETVEETTTTAITYPSYSSAEDLTYVEPTIPTTEGGIQIDESLKDQLSEIGDDIRTEIPLIQQLLEKIQGFFRIFIEFFENLVDVAFK
ncbi:MAG: hypothetical protein ACI4GY_11115 [Acutalibacteraceae bacterium]